MNRRNILSDYIGTHKNELILTKEAEEENYFKNIPIFQNLKSTCCHLHKKQLWVISAV